VDVISLTSSDADSLDWVHRAAAAIIQSPTVSTGVTEAAAVLPPSLLFLTDVTIHVAAYAAAFLFAVLVAAVSPFGFSWPYK